MELDTCTGRVLSAIFTESRDKTYRIPTRFGQLSACPEIGHRRSSFRLIKLTLLNLKYWRVNKPIMKKIILVLLSFMFLGSAHAAVTDSKDGLSLGSKVPDFKLESVTSGAEFSPAQLKDKKALMVVFMCRHCPYVQHVKKALASVGHDYEGRQVAILGISSNDPKAYPDDSPERLAEMASEEGFTFPLLFDSTQEVAKAFGAQATPEIFIFDKEQKLVYHGQFDDTRPNSDKEATGADVRAVLEALLSGQPVSARQKPAQGCSIKWKQDKGVH